MVTLNQTDQNKNITNHKKLDTTESNDITATIRYLALTVVHRPLDSSGATHIMLVVRNNCGGESLNIAITKSIKRHTKLQTYYHEYVDIYSITAILDSNKGIE